MQIRLEPIGYVANGIESQTDCGWADVESKLMIKEKLIPALDGLDEFSHLLVVFWMHQAPPPSVLRRRPQNRNDMPELGILSQRAKHRPNPIGVTAVRLVQIKGPEIKVRGLDAVNGTPILDIKPYFLQYDCRPEAHMPSWVEQLMKEYF
jgi:tRNA-Thr(GGU) m(6)t(6)A37 methyltransferase TsaA